jgi:hypothetical protein
VPVISWLEISIPEKVRDNIDLQEKLVRQIISSIKEKA